MYSKYVYLDKDRLFNTVTGVSLRQDSDEATLRKHFFLLGQERESLEARLLRSEIRSLAIKIIPTWECNLRCKHCFVLSKLKKHEEHKFDPKATGEFCKRVLSELPLKEFGLGFVGGEATLTPDLCSDLLDLVQPVTELYPKLKFKTSITTNAASFNKEIYRLLSKIQQITVSLDGTPETHNTQRKAITPELRSHDLFRVTLRNIKRMVLAGLGDRLSVQASLLESDYRPDVIEGFFRAVLKCGVKPEKILVGSTAPTDHRPGITELFKNAFRHPIHFRQCCKYRLASDWTIDANGVIYCDYFQPAEESYLGTINDDISKLVDAHRRIIVETMPVLNDAKCLECPVLGACWGRCCNTEKIVRPSEICDQEALVEKVNTLAREGKLISHYYNHRAGDP